MYKCCCQSIARIRVRATLCTECCEPLCLAFPKMLCACDLPRDRDANFSGEFFSGYMMWGFNGIQSNSWYCDRIFSKSSRWCMHGRNQILFVVCKVLSCIYGSKLFFFAVESAACQTCAKMGVAKLTLPSAYIGSVVTAESPTPNACGSVNCPWLIEVQSGQTINITLFDFAMEQRGSPPGTSVGAGSESFVSKESCFRYANVKELPNPKMVPVCGGLGRSQLVYSSVTNTVEIHIVSAEVFSRKGQFVFYYEGIVRFSSA